MENHRSYFTEFSYLTSECNEKSVTEIILFLFFALKGCIYHRGDILVKRVTEFTRVDKTVPR